MIQRLMRQDRKITDSVPESGTLDFLGRNNFMTIPINKDPDTEYKNELMFGYTLKEVLCVAAALLIIAGVTALVYFKFNIALNVGCYFGIPLAFPVIFLGFKEWYGMSITRFISELGYEKKTRELAFDADELEEYITPVTLRKK